MAVVKLIDSDSNKPLSYQTADLVVVFKNRQWLQTARRSRSGTASLSQKPLAKVSLREVTANFEQHKPLVNYRSNRQKTKLTAGFNETASRKS